MVGADGRTPNYRLHGRNFIGKVLEFGEIVHAKPMIKKPRKRSLRSRTVMGIWFGIEPRTGEHRVALLDGGLAYESGPSFAPPTARSGKLTRC